jgi:GNAT superfamily N-acetyltransferase
MLDYTLVSTLATYRLLTPRDMPGFITMVRTRYNEEMPESPIPAEQVIATVRELEHNRDRGTVFIFDREESLVGYCILVNYWSNEYGGTVLCVDELYVTPGQRGQGIASDFLNLIAKVAPEGCRAMQLEVKTRNRKAMGFYRKLGFEDVRRTILSRPIKQETERDAS